MSYGVEPQDIAEQLQIPVDTVKLILVNCSPDVKDLVKQLPKEAREVFSRHQMEEAAEVIYGIARDELVDPGVRLRAGITVLDEYMGRRDQKSIRDILEKGVNVVQINNHYRQAKKAYEEVIDV